MAILRCWTTRLAYTLLGIVLIWAVYQLLGGPINVSDPPPDAAEKAPPVDAEVTGTASLVPDGPVSVPSAVAVPIDRSLESSDPAYRTSQRDLFTVPARAPVSPPVLPPVLPPAEPDPTARLQGDIESFH